MYFRLESPGNEGKAKSNGIKRHQLKYSENVPLVNLQ